MARPNIPKKDNKAKVKARLSSGGQVKKRQGTLRITRSVTKQLETAHEHNQGSPLFRLPGELRNRIYEYAIGGNMVIFLNEWGDSSFFGSKFNLKCGPYCTRERATKKAWDNLFHLGLACRQLHFETKLLPYKLNSFVIVFSSGFDDVLTQMKDMYKCAITTLAFVYCDWDCLLKADKYETTRGKLEEYKGLTTVVLISPDEDSARTSLLEKFAEKRGPKFVIGDSDMDDDIDLGNYI